MFTKLKQKVTEQSKSDLTSLVASESPLLLSSVNNSVKQAGGESLSSKKSSSDDGQSSDDAASVTHSQTSKQANTSECLEDQVKSSTEHNNESSGAYSEEIGAKLRDKCDLEGDQSFKAQFYQLNQSLLSQIDELTVICLHVDWFYGFFFYKFLFFFKERAK